MACNETSAAHDGLMTAADSESVTTALSLVRSELDAALGALDATQIDTIVDALGGAERIFVHGAGRSGIALRMTAMRLMHLGRIVFVVGDATTPAIGPGDVLLTASGSGTTESIVRAARAAVGARADVVVITTAAESELAVLSTASVIVAAAAKLDRSASVSAQYAGSLFEQLVVLIGDTVFQTLWKRLGPSADDLWRRHSNLE
jgi:6-phospho-3-hexuloisomerase